MLLGCVLIPISTFVRIKMSFTLATNLIGFLLDGVEFNTQENRFPFKKKDEEENRKSFVSLRAFSLPLAWNTSTRSFVSLILICPLQTRGKCLIRICLISFQFRLCVRACVRHIFGFDKCYNPNEFVARERKSALKITPRYFDWMRYWKQSLGTCNQHRWQRKRTRKRVFCSHDCRLLAGGGER